MKPSYTSPEYQAAHPRLCAVDAQYSAARLSLFGAGRDNDIGRLPDEYLHNGEIIDR